MHRLVVMLSIFFSIFLMASVSSSEAAQPAGEEYWKKVLPNTPMPRAIKNLLTREDVCSKDCATIDDTCNKCKSRTKMHEVSVTIDVNFNSYGGRHGVTKTHYDPDIAVFFLPKDLRTGTKMTLRFRDPSVSSATFVSPSEADSLPFTSSKLPDILNHFSIEPRSNEAAAMRQTLADCEEAALEGEKKYCATSLESMIDFTVTALGSRDVVALSTSVHKENSPKQQYEITSFRARDKRAGYSSVVCHASSYAYAVFYCHTTKESEIYHVSLVGKDGTNVEAVATCHTDTSRWDPAYIAFQMLGVKPGTVPVCHFLPQNHVVWTPK